jgi:DNA-binding transcriptional LysR family regulator
MDLDETRAFVRAVELGSLSLAAKSLGVPKSTVSRRIDALEQRLKLKLLERSSGKLTLTPTARALAPSLRGLLDDADRIAAEAMSQAGVRPRLIRVTAPLEVALWFLVEALERFTRDNPQVSVELVGSERQHDLFQDGFDVAVRVGELKDSTLIARKLGRLPSLRLYAAAGYTARFGVPRSVSELQAHCCVLLSIGREREGWALSNGKREERVRPGGIITVNSLLLVHEAVRQGMGIGLVPPALVERELQAGALTPILPDWGTQPKSLHAVYKLPRSKLDKQLTALIECLQASVELIR